MSLILLDNSYLHYIAIQALLALEGVEMPRTRKAARRESVRTSLAESIASGKYPAGAFLPSEAELGRRYRVSRVTVRGALSQLRERSGFR